MVDAEQRRQSILCQLIECLCNLYVMQGNQVFHDKLVPPIKSYQEYIVCFQILWYMHCSVSALLYAIVECSWKDTKKSLSQIAMGYLKNSKAKENPE